MRLACATLLALTACDQVDRLPVGEVRVVPPEVFAVFEESCNPGCHDGGMVTGVMFDREGTFVGNELRTVVPGDPAASRIMIRIDAGEMPLPGTLTLSPEGRYILLGWIADGAPLVDTDVDTGSATDASTSSDTGAPVYDAFLPVLAILQNNCGGDLCHRDGGPFPPQMSDDVAYDNLVGRESVPGPLYVDPGNSDGSHIIARITQTGAGMGLELMPKPPNDPLDAGQIDTIRTWIDAGALP
jgi:hypothetical protein